MTKWVEALRSGKYEQGKRRLKQRDSGHCCLGVLCDISPIMGINYNLSLTPAKVVEWSGMKTSTGELPKSYKTKHIRFHHLWQLNDFGLSFKQIANIIEHNYKAL